jgi:predicted phage tail component-like protein
MLSFDFAGKDSYLDYGILISTRPALPSPKRRVSFIDIPGRHSSLRYDEKAYDDITIAVECTVKDSENIYDKLDNIKAWLFSAGERELIFSFHSNKKYKAQVVNAIDFKQVFKYTSQFPIIFNCRPFKYSTENNLFVINNNETQVTNPGTIESEPVISIYGSGDVTFSINEEKISLTEITEKITLNSEIQDCYNDNGDNLNDKMLGEFLKINPGENVIKWTGNVDKIEVIPNWRWL